jgi:hypothetical protein
VLAVFAITNTGKAVTDRRAISKYLELAFALIVAGRAIRNGAAIALHAHAGQF